MWAAQVASPTAPPDVRVIEIPIPEPGSGEVLVRVVAAGLNRSDLQQAAGNYQPAPSLPFVLGQEGAGEVEALGPDVTRFRVGDRVAGHLPGALAQFAVGRAEELVTVPASIDLGVAASVPIAYLTAGIGLIHLAQVSPEEWVLVHAASGGVGTAAVQLARLAGARVIATAGSESKRSRLLKLGADYALPYSGVSNLMADVLQITGGAGVAVALDGAGEETYRTILEVLAENGRVVMYGTLTGVPLGGVDRLFALNGALFGINLWTSRYYLRSYHLLEQTVWPGLLDGRIQATVHDVFSLDRASHALEIIAAREHFGKIVISLDER